jgi:hypothetical protein
MGRWERMKDEFQLINLAEQTPYIISFAKRIIKTHLYEYISLPNIYRMPWQSYSHCFPTLGPEQS